MSIKKAKEFVRDNHGSTLKDDRMSDNHLMSPAEMNDELLNNAFFTDDQALTIAADLYQPLKNRIEALERILSTPKPDSPWISVEDRLPPDGMMVDVVSCNVRLTDVYFEGGKLADDIPELVIGVTHWMPIPDSQK